MCNMIVHSHQNDLPDSFMTDIPDSIAIDTETMGLMPHRDRLCLVQISKGDDTCHIIQFDNFESSKNLIALLSDTNIQKIFHYARFDVMMIYKYFGIMTKNIYCTKIASKLTRTYTNHHSLKALCADLLGIEISKEQTCTDWGQTKLTEAQKQYAATDVLYLHRLKNILDSMLERENRLELAYKCFSFLDARIMFDLMCHETYDIFSHN